MAMMRFVLAASGVARALATGYAARKPTFAKAWPTDARRPSRAPRPQTADTDPSHPWNNYTRQMARFVEEAGVTAQNITSTTLWPADYMLSGLVDSDFTLLSGKFVTPQSPVESDYDIYLWPSTLWFGDGEDNNGISQPVFEAFAGRTPWTAGPLFYSPATGAVEFMQEWCEVSFVANCTIGAFDWQTGTVSPQPVVEAIADGTVFHYSLTTIAAPEDPPLDEAKAADLDAFVAKNKWEGGWRFQQQSIAEVNTADQRASSYKYATLTNPTLSISLEVWGPGLQQSGFEMRPSAMPADPFFIFYNTVWSNSELSTDVDGYLTGYDSVTGDRGAFFDADDNLIDAASAKYRIPQNGTLVLVNPIYSTLTVPTDLMRTMRPILRALEQSVV